MQDIYKPLNERRSDRQYQSSLRAILTHGTSVKDTPQDEGVKMLFAELAPMVFRVENGAPLITERDLSKSWKTGVAEILAFINGARTQEVLSKEFGVKWWAPWVTEQKCGKIGVSVGDIGPGSYGAAFKDFPTPDGSGFDQIAHTVAQLSNPAMYKRRTIFVTPWIPFYNGWGGIQKATVSPCHGWMHWRVINGKLSLHMFQRSGDVPTGVPFNMIQYFALLLAMAQVTGLEPEKYSHSISDAHIYDGQRENVDILLSRLPGPFGRLLLDPGVKRIEDFRSHHFTIDEYSAHPALPMPTPV